MFPPGKNLVDPRFPRYREIHGDYSRCFVINKDPELYKVQGWVWDGLKISQFFIEHV